MGLDDPIVQAFTRLGAEILDATRAELKGGVMPLEVWLLERFICKVYSPNGLQFPKAQ